MAKTKATKKSAVKKTAPKKQSSKRTFEEIKDNSFSFWKPEEGESVEGTLERFETQPAKGKFAEAERGVLMTDEGDEIKLPTHAVLTKKLSELEGEYVKITCLGLVKKGKTKYFNYKIEKAV